MRKIVFYAVLREFALDRFRAAAGTVTARIAALCHKTIYYTVELQTVIKAVLDQLFKVFTSDRCFVRIQCDDKRTAVCCRRIRLGRTAGSEGSHHHNSTDAQCQKF